MSLLPDAVFNGGQMTDLPVYGGTFVGSELFEVVAPGNAVNGINYSISSALLTALLANLSTTPQIVTSGATLANPFPVPITPYRFLFNIAAASYATLALSSSYAAPVLIRDISGNADTNPIHLAFTGGQLADGLSTVTIATPYQGIWFNPLPSGGWYLG